MSSKLPVLHIGFHKAGSTTLQEALFALHPDVVNLGEPVENPNALAAMQNVWESCHRDPAQRVEFNLEHSRRSWNKALAGVKGGKVAVFSKERLTKYEFNRPCDSCIPLKLRELVGPARIVIMTRNQTKLIESWYCANVWADPKKPYSGVSPEQWREAFTKEPLYKELFHVYRYNVVARSYAEVFGRENVGIFMLEDLASNNESFARRLCEFIGVDVEQGVKLLQSKKLHARKTRRTATYEKLRKFLGSDTHFGSYVPEKVVKSFSDFLGRGHPAPTPALPSQWVAEIESYYRDDNRQLALEWDIPLEKYGYPL